MAALAQNTLLLVGCRVSSFTRDLQHLVESGLTVDAIEVFDMFPGTEHIECLATLRAARSGFRG